MAAPAGGAAACREQLDAAQREKWRALGQAACLIIALEILKASCHLASGGDAEARWQAWRPMRCREAG